MLELSGSVCEKYCGGKVSTVNANKGSHRATLGFVYSNSASEGGLGIL